MSRESIGVAMLGYAFMGKAHSRALLALQHLDAPLRPELVSISGRNREAVEPGTGAIGDLGTHIIDIARYLVGEISSVSALGHMLEAIAGEHDVAPHGATFEDGYRCAEVTDAILCSAASGRREAVTYREGE